jgi:hypothetical protein
LSQIPGRWKHAKRRKNRSQVVERDWPTHSVQGQVRAFGKVARAARYGRGPSRKAAQKMVVITGLALGAILIAALIDSFV